LDDGDLILPYGIADKEVGVGLVEIDRLLAAMV
jgi:predicted GH43/DUF377 family glycosyl hydrolase